MGLSHQITVSTERQPRSQTATKVCHSPNTDADRCHLWPATSIELSMRTVAQSQMRLPLLHTVVRRVAPPPPHPALLSDGIVAHLLDSIRAAAVRSSEQLQQLHSQPAACFGGQSAPGATSCPSSMRTATPAHPSPLHQETPAHRCRSAHCHLARCRGALETHDVVCSGGGKQ